jgi:beta-glucanase (GH16 family)
MRFLAGLALALALVPPAAHANWQLDTACSDEFNGTKLDISRWNTQYWWGAPPNGQKAVMLPNSFHVGNGVLTITAKNVPFQVGQFMGGHFTSGVLHGYGRCEFRYGYSELKFTLPKDGPGFWLAFWAQSLQGSGHPHQEIDGFEWLGGQKPRRPGTTPLFLNLHDPQEKVERFQDRSGEYSIPADGKEHTVGFDWEPTFVKWYVDGQLAFSSGPGAAANIPSGYMHPIISFSVDGDWPTMAGTLAGPATPFPAVWSIDYFHHFDWVPSGGVPTIAGPGAGSSPGPLPPVLDPLRVRLTKCTATPDEGVPGQALALSCIFTSTIDQTVTAGFEQKDYVSNASFAHMPYKPSVPVRLTANVPQTVTLWTTFPGGPDTITWDKIRFVVGDGNGGTIFDIAPMWVVGIRAPVGRGSDQPQIAYCAGHGQLLLPPGAPEPGCR